MIPIYRDYVIEAGPCYSRDTLWQAHNPDNGEEPLLFGETPDDVRGEIDWHLEWLEDRYLCRRLKVAPVLTGVRRADGTMALYRGRLQVCLLLSEVCIAEALASGWYASDGFQDRLHRVVEVADAHNELLAALKASVAP